MIRNVVIENFQGFGSRQTIPFSENNLLFGTNSSGKSSVFRAILLLKQSLDFVPRSSEGVFLFNGENASLASFENVVHKRDLTREIHLGLEVDAVESINQISGRRGSVEPAFKPSTVSLAITESVIGWTEIEVRAKWLPGRLSNDIEQVRFVFNKRAGSNQYIILSSFEESSPGAYRRAETIWAHQARVSSKTTSPREKSVEASNGPTNSLTLSDGLEFRVRRGFPLVATRNSRPSLLADLLHIVQMSIGLTLEEVAYVGPIRYVPPRLEILPNSREEGSLAKQKSKVSAFLEMLTDGRYTFVDSKTQIKDLDFLGQVKANVLFDKSMSTYVPLVDLGAGLGQVLPVLQTIASARDSGILMLEQPELHMHPAMQSNLADLLLEVTREGNVQVIAETHSESMLLRIERRAREGLRIAQESSVSFVSVDDSVGSVVTTGVLAENEDFVANIPVDFSNLRIRDLEI